MQSTVLCVQVCPVQSLVQYNNKNSALQSEVQRVVEYSEVNSLVQYYTTTLIHYTELHY